MADVKYTVGSVLGLIGTAMLFWSFLGMEFFSPSSLIFRIVGLLVLILGLLIKGPYKKPKVDERQLRVSASANTWARNVLFFYAVVLAFVASINPGIISVSWAMVGVIIVYLVVNALAYQILLRSPDSEIDSKSSKRGAE